MSRGNGGLNNLNTISDYGTTPKQVVIAVFGRPGNLPNLDRMLVKNRPLHPPDNLTATAGDQQVTLTWPAGTHDNYTIRWRAGSALTRNYSNHSYINESNSTRIDNITGTSYTHTGLTNDTTYYYSIQTNNSGETGGYVNSSFANATPAAGLSSAPTVNLSTNNASLAENGGTTTLTATLSAAASDNATITLSLSGNATLGADYSLSDNITIIAGQTSGNATLTGLNDSAYELSLIHI